MRRKEKKREEEEAALDREKRMQEAMLSIKKKFGKKRCTEGDESSGRCNRQEQK